MNDRAAQSPAKMLVKGCKKSETEKDQTGGNDQPR